MNNYVLLLKKSIIILFFVAPAVATAVAAQEPPLFNAEQQQQQTEGVLSLLRVMKRIIPAPNSLTKKENAVALKSPALSKSTAIASEKEAGSKLNRSIAKKQQFNNRWFDIQQGQDWRKWKNSRTPYFEYLVYMYFIVSFVVMWRMKFFEDKLY